MGREILLSEPLSIEEYTKRRVERYNRQQGKLDVSDGYDCKECMNRGDFAEAVQRGDGWYEVYHECKCMKVRRSIWRMQQSGLSKAIKEQKLSKFQADTDWQKRMLDTANDYLRDGVSSGAWFFTGGQVGSGKTHLCTGIARELLLKGIELRYIIWEQESKRMKAIINEPEFGDEMRKIETAECLYIDDLFKPIKGEHGDIPTSAADIRLAFQLFNYRYVNRLPTIISSEKYLTEIMDLDEATGSRIYERAKGYTLTVNRDKARNQRKVNDNLI